jgi:hypothetical protein
VCEREREELHHPFVPFCDILIIERKINSENGRRLMQRNKDFEWVNSSCELYQDLQSNSFF